MSEGSLAPRLELAALHWHALALRRHAYYLELFKSGRWTHYFTEREFIERMRDVMEATEVWSRLAGAGSAREPQVARRSAA